ncbi:TIGR04222 domain-containing membrane protein [Tautonia plasticadhaerens]|uniref:TIGR04222 domain-containing membrane protein n=1 Tax=Tautonia plasticadhaerens TaxID=2527974 RepID=A0A518H6P2_9BACT|nr:TIGR04222 domain-containing membrane protein [Tautonia plasticadhaerens]QDV36521.1 hypothetical protein ElP_44470 [Tautonia plasticadhaerens]
MNTAQSTLWGRIAAFELDEPGAPLTFTRRLARENGWGEAYARRAVEEYRRFLFLAMASGHPVTPSDQVDQAWHLHLTYTRSYWDDLCGGVLGRPLHHGPTRGGAEESAKFHDWYGRTLDSYRRFFGEEPPADFWPPAADRFGRDLHFARVNLRDHWLLPRPSTLLRGLVGRLSAVREAVGARPGPVAAVAAIALMLAGCVAPGLPMGGMGGLGLADRSGSEFLNLFVPLTVATIVCSWLLRRWAASGEGGPSDPEFALATDASKGKAKLDPYGLILLARGPDRTPPVQAAVARLVETGVLSYDEERKQLITTWSDRDRTLHPVEQAALGAVKRRASWTTWKLVQAASRSPEVGSVEDRLRDQGLLQSASEAFRIRVLPVLPLVVVLVLGLWRIGLGIERGRPVGFLVLLCGLLFVATIVHLVARPWRTRKGDALVRSMDHLRERIVKDPPSPASPEFPLAFALMGMAALPKEGTLGVLGAEIIPPPSSGGSGCGGDGGGGGGCGGGGCGGCGGGCGG